MKQFETNPGIWLFERNKAILKWNRIIINLVSFAVFMLMIARYGFEYNAQLSSYWIPIIRFFYGIYTFNFLFRLFLSRRKIEFLQSNWFETLLFALMLGSGISYFVFATPQLQRLLLSRGIELHIYEFLLLLFLLILAFVEFVKSLGFITSSKIKPTTLFIGSYFILLGVGTGLMMLPGFNVKYEFMNFYDALFTATSATCITGLSTFNVAEYLNFKGQVLLLILFQLGGIGILTFASFFATFIKKGLGIKHQILMNELFDTDSISGSLSLLKRILFFLFGIEFIGVLLMLGLWGDYPFSSFDQKLFYSVFHTVSAFCNAGFSLLPAGMKTAGVSELYLLHWLIIGLVFLGSLGFPALRDILSPTKLRERIRLPWKGWKTSTKISLYTGLVLLMGGALFYILLMPEVHTSSRWTIQSVTKGVFQSINLRSCGMSLVSLENITPPLIMISMFLMFVGGGSSSLAGGIKTSTFIVVVAAIISTIRGRKEATLGKRTIANDLIYRAFAVILFSGNFVLITTTILTFTEPDLPFLKIAFEAVSAFANTGLSMGITDALSDAGKVILSISMLAGRVGLLTLAFALSSKEKPNTVRYPKTHIIIG
jgi:trk system potassium uptake protein TrkH